MFENYTEASRRLVVLAQEEARELRHDAIEPEHFICGALHLGNDHLEKYGLDIERARAVAAATYRRLEARPVGTIELSAASGAAMIIALSIAEVTGAPGVEPGHLLAAVTTVMTTTPG